MSIRKIALASALALGTALPASAVTLDASEDSYADTGIFNDGWATKIYYESVAARGTLDNRDDAENALGANDGKFFEIGFGSEIILTFGTLFTSPGFVIEVTNGAVANWPELIDIFVGNLGDNIWQAVDQNPISNAGAQGAPGFQFTFSGGPFDALKIRDVTDTNEFPDSQTGGYDIDAVRISPIPLPAGGVLLLTALGGLAIARRRKQA